MKRMKIPRKPNPMFSEKLGWLWLLLFPFALLLAVF